MKKVEIEKGNDNERKMEMVSPAGEH